MCRRNEAYKVQPIISTKYSFFSHPYPRWSWRVYQSPCLNHSLMTGVVTWLRPDLSGIPKSSQQRLVQVCTLFKRNIREKEICFLYSRDLGLLVAISICYKEKLYLWQQKHSHTHKGKRQTNMERQKRRKRRGIRRESKSGVGKLGSASCLWEHKYTHLYCIIYKCFYSARVVFSWNRHQT